MKNAIKNFWVALLSKINDKINQWLNAPKSKLPTMDAGDDTVVNFFAMVVKKVLNRALMGAEFDVISDSAQAEPLKELCEDLNRNAYKITAYMIAGNENISGNSVAECWAVPSFIKVQGENKLVHSYIDGSRVLITGIRDDGEISECYMVLNAVKRKDKIYFLYRKHTLSDDGDLSISFFVADDEANIVEADIPEWDELIYGFAENGEKQQKETVYKGVNHIGFGRYKSPVVPLNNDTVYGVPLNYGCGAIEQQLKTDVEQIELEMKASKKMLFPDWSIVKEDTRGNAVGLGYAVDEYIYPIKKKAGVDGSLIDEYCPTIRYSEYAQKLEDDLCKYQARMGVRDLITHTENTSGATATEIKSKNADNMALEQSIRKALRKGNEETLKADSIYLNIPLDLWQYDEDYQDIYTDDTQKLNEIITVMQNGGAEVDDLVKFYFPTLSDEERAEKIARINESKQASTESSILSALNME